MLRSQEFLARSGVIDRGRNAFVTPKEGGVARNSVWMNLPPMTNSFTAKRPGFAVKPDVVRKIVQSRMKLCIRAENTGDSPIAGQGRWLPREVAAHGRISVKNAPTRQTFRLMPGLFISSDLAWGCTDRAGQDLDRCWFRRIQIPTGQLGRLPPSTEPHCSV